MRYLLFILFVFISVKVSAQQTEVIRLSDPVIETDEFEIFGIEMDINESSDTFTLSEAIETNDLESELLISAMVNKVCQKKGCFFIAVDGVLSARITFKDYGFFIPTNSAGKQIVVKGIVTEQILSEEQAIHYAEDAGELADNIAGDQKEYTIIASSIMIPKTN